MWIKITKSVESVGGEDLSCYTYREFGSKTDKAVFKPGAHRTSGVMWCDIDPI